MTDDFHSSKSWFEVVSQRFIVHYVVGREELNSLYRFEVRITESKPLDAIRPGAGCRLRIASGDGEYRDVAGVVADAKLAVAPDETGRTEYRYTVGVRPPAWRLTQRRNSRIFEELAVREVSRLILEEHAIPHDWLASGAELAREYIVQYEETDWEFLSRLWAELGLFFYYEPRSGEQDLLVVGFQAQHYRGSRAGRGELSLQYRDAPSALHGSSAVYSMSLHRRLRPEQVVAQEFDFRQPLRTIRHEASVEREESADGLHLREHFLHHANLGDQIDPSLEAIAAVRLEQHRRDILVATLQSSSIHLYPGAVTSIAGHDHSACNGRWVVTKSSRLDDGSSDAPLANVELVPADVPYRPPAPERKVVQVAESATVVGPEGSTIHTDDLGRVRVRFHWDRRSRSPEHSTCWIRPLQQWVGAHWGSQHIPRVGTEVAVTFLGGDPDRPIILGELRNAVHPPAFKLPEGKTRSGWRTQSVPEGGAHELSFEDAAGSEEVYLRSQGALREEVTTHHHTEVEGNRRSVVRGTTEQHLRGKVDQVYGSDVRNVYHGARATRLEHDDEVVIQGSLQHDVQGHLRATVGDHADVRMKATSNLTLEDDHTLAARGCITMMAGTLDEPRSISIDAEGIATLQASKSVELRSAENITLSVGPSSIHITSTEIRLHAPTIRLEGETARVLLDESLAASGNSVAIEGGEVVVASSQGASVGLTSEAMVDGTQVLLNSPTEAEVPPAPQPEANTEIVLEDLEGRRCPHRQYVLQSPSGTRQTGRLDAEGAARFYLDEPGAVFFTGVWFEETAVMPEDGHRLHHVRRGEDLHTLSVMYGVPPQQLWEHPLNAELRELRADPFILCPGDCLRIPLCDPEANPVRPGEVNSYRGALSDTAVEIQLVTGGVPLANHQCAVWGLGEPRYQSTNSEGYLRFDDPDVRTIIVQPRGHDPLALEIGDLDPGQTIRGVQSRLQGLGYYQDEVTGVIGLTTFAAIAAFCADYGLPETSIPDERFCDKLVEVYGR